MSVPVTTSTLSMQSFYSSTLSSSIVAGDTVIPLNAVPTGTEGFLVIDQDNASKEIIYYNSKGASSVTCPSAAAGRGQGGTTAVSHSSGATVKMNFVDQYWSELQNGHAMKANSILSTKLGLSAALDATNGVKSQANAGTAGGTMYYINLGGIKLCWGIAASQTVGSNTSDNFTVTLPTSFFATIQASLPVMEVAAGSVLAYITGVSCSATTLTYAVVNPTASPSIGGVASFFIIGT